MLKNPMKHTIWIKWYAKAPQGYFNTGVYNASSDSYLWSAL